MVHIAILLLNYFIISIDLNLREIISFLFNCEVTIALLLNCINTAIILLQLKKFNFWGDLHFCLLNKNLDFLW